MRTDKQRRFEGVYAEYKDIVLKLALMYLKDYQLAEDAAQEVFFKVYKKLGTLRDDDKIKPWISKIVVNTCKNQLAHKSRREIPSEDVYPDSVKTDNFDDQITIADAIQNLELELREVVLLYYYQELSRAQISSILKIPETTVDYRLRTARKKLKNFLKEDYNE